MLIGSHCIPALVFDPSTELSDMQNQGISNLMDYARNSILGYLEDKKESYSHVESQVYWRNRVLPLDPLDYLGRTYEYDSKAGVVNDWNPRIKYYKIVYPDFSSVWIPFSAVDYICFTAWDECLSEELFVGKHFKVFRSSRDGWKWCYGTVSEFDGFKFTLAFADGKRHRTSSLPLVSNKAQRFHLVRNLEYNLFKDGIGIYILVGRTVEIYFPDYSRWYTGKVTNVHSNTKKFQVKFPDETKKLWYHLDEHKWRLSQLE
eukprot:TRINITY_DN8475_c0_g1_i1.p1 TRINITY_DN8475_c0_g1~~TRINITY_DN8475_c0_g1_i1.p1  ORF type:complete len:260 (+),score=38.18 TRINITY_DN8475_c0_g1_i1:189-968(+)